MEQATDPPPTENFLAGLTEALTQARASNIVVYTVKGNSFANHAIVATVYAAAQLHKQVPHQLEPVFKEYCAEQPHYECNTDSEWLLILAGGILIHVVTQEKREEMQFEKLYSTNA